MSRTSNGHAESHPHYAFMYGTLKSNEPNHKQLYSRGPGGAKFCGRAKTLAKFPLLVTTPFNIPFLLHKEGIGHRIEGELYKLDEETLKHVDDFEGHPHWYVRQTVQVEVLTDSQSNKIEPYIVDTWMYGLKRFKPSLLELPLVEVYHDSHYDISRRYRPYDVVRDGPLQSYLFDDE
ncbi:putative gamma-glutamylcyclotransferase CG2811 [Biomphalaria glabrata]|uniref:Gamma-glutamylcyclotransferase family protein n=1 Tax=Biomphalaria glabrata TaxID=6526 RepID=A0A9W2YDN6_BIOGL|nr:putative gamma-glutamylcyclotransferase CG2811 [Biomphalaria glabrata]